MFFFFLNYYYFQEYAVCIMKGSQGDCALCLNGREIGCETLAFLV